MRKVDREYDNPIDNFLLDIGDYVLPFFKNTGHTPNMLTTYSLIFGLISVYFLYKDNLFNFAICFIVSYIFDCWDGYMARIYSMTSKFGDLYDHISDLTVGFLLAYVAYSKYKHKLNIYLIIVIIVMTYLVHKHIGCYQKVYKENNNKKENETIDFTTQLCPNKNDITWVRYFGLGTYNVIFLVGLMYYLKYT
jgi:phosphatidylglycerophosphate synthase